MSDKLTNWWWVWIGSTVRMNLHDLERTPSGKEWWMQDPNVSSTLLSEKGIIWVSSTLPHPAVLFYPHSVATPPCLHISSLVVNICFPSVFHVCFSFSGHTIISFFVSFFSVRVAIVLLSPSEAITVWCEMRKQTRLANYSFGQSDRRDICVSSDPLFYLRHTICKSFTCIKDKYLKIKKILENVTI